MRVIKLVVFTAIILSLSSAVALDVEMRGLWVVRDALTSTESISELVEYAHQNNYNTIFVQVRGAGDAYYISETEPRPSSLDDCPPDFDPLDLIIRLAGEKNISVHAWLNTMYAFPGKGYELDYSHILFKHPDWITVGRDIPDPWDVERVELLKRDSEGLYLSPFQNGVVEYLCSVVGELVENYDLDGIHLDFIRYPNVRFGYDQVARYEFKEKYGIDPLKFAYHQVNSQTPYSYGEIYIDVMTIQWYQYRADCITNVVEQIADTIKEKNEGIQYSTAVWFPPTFSFRYVGQEWVKWLDEGYIDFAVPMAYWADIEDFDSHIKPLTESGLKVSVGLGAWEKGRERIEEEIEHLRGIGVLGYVLFSYNDIYKNREQWAELRDNKMKSISLSPKLNEPDSWLSMFNVAYVEDEKIKNVRFSKSNNGDSINLYLNNLVNLGEYIGEVNIIEPDDFEETLERMGQRGGYLRALDLRELEYLLSACKFISSRLYPIVDVEKSELSELLKHYEKDFNFKKKSLREKIGIIEEEILIEELDFLIKKEI